MRRVWLLVLAVGLTVAASACGPSPTPTPPEVYSLPQLEYRLLARFADFFWCDPDYYPVGRPEQEKKNSLEQFAATRANAAEFSAILAQLTLSDRPEYSDAETLLIYREHKKLSLAVQMAASGDGYSFILRVGEGQGERIEGTIARSGDIRVTRREPSFNTCPICLACGTIIDTPGGPVAVERLSAGMAVWTLDGNGRRVSARVRETVTTPVLPPFGTVTVVLGDGRSVTASPGHPAADGRLLGDFRVGDALDGARVTAVKRVPYNGGATHDILPSGATGLYWANGILLRSTLARR